MLALTASPTLTATPNSSTNSSPPAAPTPTPPGPAPPPAPRIPPAPVPHRGRCPTRTTPRSAPAPLPVPAPASPPAPPPLVPKSIPKAPNVNPYLTTFVQADTSSFKQVVQMLTGSVETVAAAAAASTTSKGPPSPADGHGTATPLRGLQPRSREGNGGCLRWPCLPRLGLRPKKVAIHSSWITLVSLFLIRFSTADTSGPTKTRVFAIAGAGAASLPSLLIFLSTATITCFLEVGFCDLTWIFSGSGNGPPWGKRRQDRSTEGDGKGEPLRA